MADDFFAPPPFKPDEAVQRLRRDLRELGLQERAGQFEWKGQAAVRLQPGKDMVEASLARALARTPQWSTRTLRNGAEVRDFVSACKRLLSQQAERDE